MVRCTTFECRGEPIDPAVSEALGLPAGLCVECTSQMQVWSPTTEQEEQEQRDRRSEPVEPAIRSADRAAAAAFFEGAPPEPEELFEGNYGRRGKGADYLGSLVRLAKLDESRRVPGLDRLDRRLIAEAQRLGRVEFRPLSDAVGLSLRAVYRRVRRMVDSTRFFRPMDAEGWRRFKLTLYRPDSPEGLPFDDLQSFDADVQRRRAAYRSVFLQRSRPERCLDCKRFLPRPATGRPRKYCNDACRGRFRRRHAA